MSRVGARRRLQASRRITAGIGRKRGATIFVADRGAVRFDFPRGSGSSFPTKREPSSSTTRSRPTTTAVLQLTVHVFATTTKYDWSGPRSWFPRSTRISPPKDTRDVLAPRRDSESSKKGRHGRWPGSSVKLHGDPLENQRGVCGPHVAWRGSGTSQPIISFDFWVRRRRPRWSQSWDDPPANAGARRLHRRPHPTRPGLVDPYDAGLSSRSVGPASAGLPWQPRGRHSRPYERPDLAPLWMS